MGLLSNPSLMPRSKWVKMLARHHTKVYVICYLLSIVWFICLSHVNFNHSTYVSENALSPGLVYPEIKMNSVRLLQKYADELDRERQRYKSLTPHAWIEEKMKEIGLETYVHEFSLMSPFQPYQQYRCKNVYGILRASRASSTEGIVFSAPYRPPSSPHPDITASVPTLLTFADFARGKNYWSKDLIFLVTEEEHLGVHAFLEAYHNEQHNKSAYLKYGSLPGRAGSLQAAINLEIADLNIDHINVKIEGLNGQLPNLDLFNVVQRIAIREGLVSGYKQSVFRRIHPKTSSTQAILQNIRNMLTMLWSQVTGVPSGNHGFFHRYHIEAITLEGCVKGAKASVSGNNSYKLNAALSLLKTIEGVSRSLNNLLESFHQSYFFYILVQNDRFISIGDYIPCLILLIVPLYTEAFLLWMMAVGNLSQGQGDEGEQEELESPSKKHFINESVVPALNFMMMATGTMAFFQRLYLLDTLQSALHGHGVTTSEMVGLVTAFWLAASLVLPLLINLSAKSLQWLHMMCLLGLATILAVLGVLNFSLAYFTAIVSLPLAMWVRNVKRSVPTVLYALLLNPLVLVCCLVALSALLEFPGDRVPILLKKVRDGCLETFKLTLVDHLIYNNWLLSVISCALLPLWCGFWALTISGAHRLSATTS